MENTIIIKPNRIADLVSNLQSQQQLNELLDKENHTIPETIKEYLAKECF